MKKLETLNKKIRVESEKLSKLETEFSDKISEKLKQIEFISCRHCKSRMDTRFRSFTLKCPVCKGSFLSESDLNKKQKSLDKIEALKATYKSEVEKNSKVLDKDAIIRAVKSTSTFNDYLRGRISTIEFISANPSGVGEVEFSFSADKNDGVLYDGGRVEDNDWPEFIGENLIINAIKKVDSSLKFSVQDHEKGYFSVYVKGVLK